MDIYARLVLVFVYRFKHHAEIVGNDARVIAPRLEGIAPEEMALAAAPDTVPFTLFGAK